jgi:hypothetical protein
MNMTIKPVHRPQWFYNFYFGLVRRLALVMAMAVPTWSALADAKPVFLGPPDPGAEHGFDYWYHGANGAGFLYVDNKDPAKGEQDFSLGNNTEGSENRADWRSQCFPLGPAAAGDSPITFSFAYKLADKNTGNDNIMLFLRFFDASGTRFLDQEPVWVGTRSGDSKMDDYKTVRIANIHAPKAARTADIWVTANIFDHWTSGTARFDDFSVTTVPVSHPGRILARTGLGLGSAIVLVVLARWARSALRKRAGT